MNDKVLRIYLNDHLSGAVAGLDLARRARASIGDHGSEGWLDRVVQQIDEDKGLVRELLGRIDGSPSDLKRPLAWLTERAARPMLWLRHQRHATLGAVEQLEALLLGIRGKLGLWILLESLDHPRFADVDLQNLKARARRQMEDVDELRLALAREAFR